MGILCQDGQRADVGSTRTRLYIEGCRCRSKPDPNNARSHFPKYIQQPSSSSNATSRLRHCCRIHFKFLRRRNPKTYASLGSYGCGRERTDRFPLVGRVLPWIRHNVHSNVNEFVRRLAKGQTRSASTTDLIIVSIRALCAHKCTQPFKSKEFDYVRLCGP